MIGSFSHEGSNFKYATIGERYIIFGVYKIVLMKIPFD